MMPYKIIRSKRKTVAIHVSKDAAVEVRAPIKMAMSDIEEFIRQKQGWIEKAVQKMSRRKESAIVLSHDRELELRQMAESIIPKRVAFYAEVMGAVPTAVKIGGAKTRWGSCSGKNSLNFSWRLMLCDMDVVDYVVVHELAHIREHNHSKRFWKVVEGVLPCYRERRNKLKDIYLG